MDRGYINLKDITTAWSHSNTDFHLKGVVLLWYVAHKRTGRAWFSIKGICATHGATTQLGLTFVHDMQMAKKEWPRDFWNLSPFTHPVTWLIIAFVCRNIPVKLDLMSFNCTFAHVLHFIFRSVGNAARAKFAIYHYREMIPLCLRWHTCSTPHNGLYFRCCF